MARSPTYLLFSVLVAAVSMLSGCKRNEPAESATAVRATPGLTKLSYQLDWYPAPEHGGHYQALVKGYYREVGLDVTIVAGGPGAFGVQKVLAGDVALAMGREDDIALAVNQGLPLLIVGALMQHDPQAIMVHADSPVQSFKDLDGRSLMGSPGANWIVYLQKHYGIQFNVMPVDYGLARFMADPGFIQQCFISNEPYHAELNGAKTRALLIANGGYDPYRVYFTSQAYARAHPEAVRAFVAASIRGWQEFLYGDATEARALIAKENPSQTAPLMDYSIAAMKRYQLVDGDPARGERLGLLNHERMIGMGRMLVELGVVAQPVPLERYVSFEFLPPELRALSGDPSLSAKP